MIAGMALGRSDIVGVLDRLFADRPSLHGHGAQPVNWQLGDALLRWLLDELPDRPATLETGCGYSTIAFAALSGSHTVVSPVAVEHDRVRAWCAAHGISVEHVRFITEPSQVWLPAAATTGALRDLDAVLIDGDHAHPLPSIDWYYTAGALRVGGLLVVDDVSIRACLATETGRWDLVTTIDDAAVFRKLSSDVVDYIPWSQQPWNQRLPARNGPLARLRSAVRLRTRLRTFRDHS
jgi:predicted O-methyltransferase YrrM